MFDSDNNSSLQVHQLMMSLYNVVKSFQPYVLHELGSPTNKITFTDNLITNEYQISDLTMSLHIG